MIDIKDFIIILKKENWDWDSIVFENSKGERESFKEIDVEFQSENSDIAYLIIKTEE